MLNILSNFATKLCISFDSVFIAETLSNVQFFIVKMRVNKINNNNMSISLRVKEFCLLVMFAFMSLTAYSQITVHGTVKNDKGDGMAGAFIRVDSTNIITLTDLRGSFHLSIPEIYKNRQVVVSYVGYLNESFKASDGNLDIVLRAKETQTIADVLVSTQKRLQSTVEVPIALSVIDSAKIRQTDLYSIDEMSRFVPGFTALVLNEENTVYGIRGVSSSMQESYAQSRVSVYVDGISISRLQSSYLELFDMERVEVVKGPQGTLFGRSAELGAVHFIRKKPTNEFSASVAAMYGNYNNRKVVGVINTPLNDNISNRFAFDYIAHDGYIKTNDGGSLNGKNTIAVRNSTSFHLSDKVDFNMVLDYQHDDSPGTSYQNKKQFSRSGELINDNKSPFTKAYLTNGKDLYTKRDVGGFLGQLDWDINKHFDFNSTTGIRANNGEEYYDIDGTELFILEGHDKTKALEVSQELRCNWSLGKKLNGFFGASYFYERIKHSFVFNGNLRIVAPLTVGQNVKSSFAALPKNVIAGIQQVVLQWSEPVKKDHPEYAEQIDQLCLQFNNVIAERINTQFSNLSENWFNTMYWETTPDFFSDTKKAVSSLLLQTLNEFAAEYPLFTSLLETDGQNVEGVLGELDLDEGLAQLKPLSSVPLSDVQSENETDYNHTHEASVFADFSWNIYKRLYLTFGIRSTYETIKSGYSSTSKEAPVLGYIIFTGTDDQVVWTKEKYNSIVGRVVLNWMMNPTHNLYFSASRGRRPGMLYFNGNPEDIQSLSPETTLSYELGIKGTTKYGHLSYALAFYYYDWFHFQTALVGRGASESGSLSYMSSDNGKAYGMGTEMSAVYTFKPEVSLFADFAYTGCAFSDEDMNGNMQSNAGNMFVNTPNVTFDMGFVWKKDLSGGKSIYMSPSFYTQSKVYFNEENSSDHEQDAYLLLNGNIGMQFIRNKVTYDIGLYGRNITNTKYYCKIGNGSDVLGMPTYEVGAPATINLALKLFFK